MIDFNKRLGTRSLEKKINPVEIYDSLDRRSEKGPLRPAQFSILNNWFDNHRDTKDIIVKLHTGQGKTLIGLLMLQSRINQDLGPALYVCPNKYLVEQSVEQAKLFGIKVCRIDDNNTIPSDFFEGKEILITHAQKIFNGKSIFGIGQRFEKVDSIVLDDSHACIDTIMDSCTIKLKSTDLPYSLLLNLFENDINKQGVSDLQEIKSGEYDSFSLIPYWAWQDKINDVVKIMVDHKELNSIKFSWEILKDRIRDCQCFISGSQIEISSYFNPIDLFGSFHHATQRILMSATTNNDAFFIKGLGFSVDSVKQPLIYEKEHWSGEKMILIPYFIDPELDRTNIVNKFAKKSDKRNYGIVALTPSFKDAQYWETLGAKLVDTNNIDQILKDFKDKNYNETIVIANRYDGIDLPDDTCRILIIDSKPFSQSLCDKYQENCRLHSDIIDIKVAQKIEQGLGRGVRGEKDYCVVIITGSDLIAAIRNKRFQKFFSPQTRKQIEIGLNVTKFATEDGETNGAVKAIDALLKQFLQRDEGWKQYYYNEMDGIEKSIPNDGILDVLELERQALEYYSKGNYLKCTATIQKIIDNHIPKENFSEIGWYLQEIAKFSYSHNRLEANSLQMSAFKNNRYLLKPISGVVFEKLLIQQDRVNAIQKYISSFNSFSLLMADVDSIINNLYFGSPAAKFEKAIYDLGKIIGFSSERPEKEWKEGPDNLWGLKNNDYLIFECKSEVKITRSEIFQSETEQMSNSCAWFKHNYPGSDLISVMVIPTNYLAKGAYPSDDIKIIRDMELKKITKAVRGFFNDFKAYDLHSLSERQISHLLSLHKLTVSDIKNQYMEEIAKRK
jgi:replicative superfamily II helicase